MKDVRLPQDLQRAMAAEAEASREARAKVTSSKIWTREARAKVKTSIKAKQMLARGFKRSSSKSEMTQFSGKSPNCISKKKLRNSQNCRKCHKIEVYTWQVIAAEGEQKASKALKEASDIITESPAALQLRQNITISQHHFLRVQVFNDFIGIPQYRNIIFLECKCSMVL